MCRELPVHERHHAKVSAEEEVLRTEVTMYGSSSLTVQYRREDGGRVRLEASEECTGRAEHFSRSAVVEQALSRLTGDPPQP